MTLTCSFVYGTTYHWEALHRGFSALLPTWEFTNWTCSGCHFETCRPFHDTFLFGEAGKGQVGQFWPCHFRLRRLPCRAFLELPFLTDVYVACWRERGWMHTASVCVLCTRHYCSIIISWFKGRKRMCNKWNGSLGVEVTEWIERSCAFLGDTWLQNTPAPS